VTDLHVVLAGAIAIERAAPPIMPVSASTSCSAAYGSKAHDPAQPGSNSTKTGNALHQQ